MEVPLPHRALVVTFALALLPVQAEAQQLRFETTVDVPLTLGAGLLWALSPELEPSPARPAVAGPGGIDGIAPLSFHHEPARVSDVLLWSAIGGSVLVTSLDGRADGQLAERLVLHAQALALTGALTGIVKNAVGRQRPYAYGEGKGAVDERRSFFSGHASMTAAAAFSTVRALDLTADYDTGTRIALYGGAGAVAVSVAALRVSAGAHFPTDVLVGTLVGTGIGLLVPELHRPSMPVMITAPGGRQLAVAVALP